MQMNDMILVSVDDHVCEPPDMWDRHVPPKWKGRAPRLVTKDDGTNLWVFEGQQVPNVGLNAVAGRPPDRVHRPASRAPRVDQMAADKPVSAKNKGGLISVRHYGTN